MIMIIATILYAIALPFAVTMAMFSPMASDGGINTGVWVIIISFMTLPIGILVAVILGWIFYATRLPGLMWASILLPFLWIFPIVFAPFPPHH